MLSMPRRFTSGHLLLWQQSSIQLITGIRVIAEWCFWLFNLHVTIVFVRRMVCLQNIDLIEFRTLSVSTSGDHRSLRFVFILDGQPITHPECLSKLLELLRIPLHDFFTSSELDCWALQAIFEALCFVARNWNENRLTFCLAQNKTTTTTTTTLKNLFTNELCYLSQVYGITCYCVWMIAFACFFRGKKLTFLKFQMFGTVNWSLRR